MFGIALGYEDLNDHDELRHDPLMAVLAAKLEACRSDCAPVAGKSTLNRLELSRETATRYHKISHEPSAIEALFVDLFLEAHAKAPKQIISSTSTRPTTRCMAIRKADSSTATTIVTATCRSMYSAAGICWRPSSGRRTSTAAPARSRKLREFIAQIRARWPRTRILLRADFGFAREALMRWCEMNRVDFVFGLARNARLVEEIAVELANAEEESRRTGQPARRFKDFHYATLDSWSRRRRVIGKAEWTQGEANPRFIVTSLKKAETNGRLLYEKVYCARGDMENRIKECQGDLFADRTSTATMRANQLRLWLASFAYALICAVRRVGLAHTQFAQATCGTIRLKLLKLAGLVRITARRIKFALASAHPYANEWRLAAARLA